MTVLSLTMPAALVLTAVAAGIAIGMASRYIPEPYGGIAAVTLALSAIVGGWIVRRKDERD